MKLCLAPETTAFSQAASTKRAERESGDPWFPFRLPAEARRVQALIEDSLNVRIQCGELDVNYVRRCSRQLLNIILEALSSSPGGLLLAPDLLTTAFELSRLMIHEMVHGCTSREDLNRAFEDTGDSSLSNLGRVLCSGALHRLTQPVQLVQELSKLYDIGLCHGAQLVCAGVLDVLAAVSSRSDAVNDLCQSGMMKACLRCLLETWSSGSGVRAKGSILRLLSLPKAAELVFTSDAIQLVIDKATLLLLSSSVFTEAMNSSPDEYPCEVRQEMDELAFLRCCLGTQHAAAALLRSDYAASEHNLILRFIAHTLAHHGDKCMSTCDREDLCTLAWEMALALASSIPAALACADFFVENKVVVLLGKETQNRGEGDWVVSACTLLQKQLQHLFEVVGGSSEKVQRCALYEFDPVSTGWGANNANGNAPAQSAIRSGVPPLVQTLLEKMCSSIQGSCDRSVPLDFVMLSQTSWELILETEDTEERASPLSNLELTKVFGRLMYELVASKRSRLAESVSDTARTPLPTSKVEAEFPSDAQRKLLNQLYKGYCNRLNLKASPTTLHCIIKKFGRGAIDTFPVTILMVLDQLFSEKEALAFLVHCWSSPDGAFLWPFAAKSAASRDGESPLHKVASAVELILAHEDHQVQPEALHRCSHCEWWLIDS